MKKYLSEDDVKEINCNIIYKKNDCGGNIVFVKRRIIFQNKKYTIEFYRHNNVWNVNKKINFSKELQKYIDKELDVLNKNYIQQSVELKNREDYFNLYRDYKDAEELEYYDDKSPEHERIQYILNNIKQSDVVYDVACNSGGIGKRLIDEKNCTVYGSEISKELAKRAEGKGLKIFYGFAEDINFSRDFFDVVILSFILEHVLNPEIFMKVTVDTLKKGGKVVGCVPTEFGDWGTHTIHYHPEHLRAYNRNSLIKLFEKFNLKNINIEESFLINRQIADYYLFAAQK